jgi:hypothetical protein
MPRKAIFTYGRLNPPTIGHKLMIDNLIKEAKKNNADPYIVITHTQNKKKNPLSVDEKMLLIARMYPGIPILATSKQEPNPTYIVNKLKTNGYADVSMMVGSNRIGQFDWVGVPVVSGGVRNANTNKPTGVSATEARKAATKGNLNTFARMVNTNNPNKWMRLIANRLK